MNVIHLDGIGMLAMPVSHDHRCPSLRLAIRRK